MTNRIIYLGSADAIDAHAMEGLTPADMDLLEQAVSAHPALAAKVQRAREWSGNPEHKLVTSRVRAACSTCEDAYAPLGTEGDHGLARRWAETHLDPHPGHSTVVTFEVNHSYA